MHRFHIVWMETMLLDIERFKNIKDESTVKRVKIEVDINTEEARLAENQIKYQALVDLMNQEFARYNTVLSSGN